MKKIISIFLAFSIILCLSACKNNSQEKSTRSGIFFDTLIKLTVFGSDDGLLDTCFELARDYDKLLSKDSETSDVYRLNNAGGKEIKIDKKTAEIIEDALKYEALSDGKFSPLLGSVTELWGFGKENAGLPKDEELKNALASAKNGKIILENTRARLTNGAKIDLGAFAKGFIADKLYEIYKEKNKSGIIDLGGNILTVGEKENGEPFSVGIKDPESPENTKFTIYCGETSVVTSGVYERNFTQNGKFYHHILNPETGFPASTGLLSVTVISKNSALADAFSTALFCLGETKGLKLLADFSNVEAVFILENGETVLSDGLKLNGDKISLK